jgi:hypothetical protein
MPYCQKLTLGLLATIAHELVPFCAYAPFPALLPFFKCTLEVVLCEGVHHRLQLSFFNSTLSKWRPFNFIFNRGNSSFAAKVQGKVFAHFHAVTVKHHSSMWNWLLGLPR